MPTHSTFGSPARRSASYLATSERGLRCGTVGLSMMPPSREPDAELCHDVLDAARGARDTAVVAGACVVERDHRVRALLEPQRAGIPGARHRVGRIRVLREADLVEEERRHAIVRSRR